MKGAVILLVENEENDVFFFRRALAAVNYQGDVRVVRSATDARAYLEGTRRFRDRSYYPLPNLIVCDFKLHGGTGADLLEWIQTHGEFAEIPFVLFTGSATDDEGRAAVRAGARAFISKSGDFMEMKEKVEAILQHLPLRPRIPTESPRQKQQPIE
ncbi:MAG: response regulator [Akkermansiaceae bacterium]|nr:response regulator [Verrucomicrobiales bacterium]